MKSMSVARLVLSAFSGPAPSLTHQVNHIDGVKGNNSPNNLEWVTPSENGKHAWRTGLNGPRSRPDLIANLLKGRDAAREANAKLTAQQVTQIRSRCGRGEAQRVVALEYGVSQATVSHVVNFIGYP